MNKKSLFLFLLLISYVFPHQNGYSQFEHDYIPMDSFDVDKEQLIDDIEVRLDQLKNTLPRSVRAEVMDFYERQTETLGKLVDSNYFLKDRALADRLDRIYNEITTKNPREGYPVRLMISRDPAVNAQCWGEGTMIIHLGLLARVKTESELAFVLAHEMAHQLLDHVNRRLAEALERRDKGDLREQVQESGKLTVLKTLAFKDSKYSRKSEKQADSLAVLLLKNTIYDWTAYRQALLMLDSADYPEKRAPELRSFFDFSRFPFREKWLVRDESAFGARDNEKRFIFNSDSIQSHPDVSLRIEYLNTLFPGDIREIKSSRAKSLPGHFQQRIDLELSQSAFIIEDYGRAMFYALQGLEQYPENKFLKTLIARIWLKLYMARKNHVYSRYIPVSNYYPKGMEDIFIFLNNLRLSEIGSIGFNYLNRDEVFDRSNEVHYQLLWCIGTELKLFDICKKVAAAYVDKFPEGRFKMELDINKLK